MLAGLALLILGGGGGWYLLGEVVERSAPRMAGMPILVPAEDRWTVIVLTSHTATRNARWRLLLGRAREPHDLHWDLWAFDGSDLRQRWVTRLGSVRRGQPEADRGILGAEDGTVWVLADRLVLVSASAGRILGDAASLESRNPRVFRARFPNNARSFIFDQGLIVVAPDGTRLRADPRSLTTRPEAAVALRTNAMTPLRPLPADRPGVLRGLVQDNRWYGMMTAAEAPGFTARGATDDAGFPARDTLYRLWSGVNRVERDASGVERTVLANLRPEPGGAEFLEGGLLATVTAFGLLDPVIMSGRTRLLVLHRDSLRPGLALSCVELTGTACWRAGLGMRALTAVGVIQGLTEMLGAVLLVGEGTESEAGRTGGQRIVRVSAQGGGMSAVDIAALDTATVAAARAD
jgi:hypothetical protein